MKKFLLCLLITLAFSGCARNRDAEIRTTDNAHNFIEQIFNAKW